jgi:serine/threonine protein kinase
MIVMERANTNLREYLQQNHNKLTWIERINIIFEIISTLVVIHEENSIHRDLHSGNILYLQFFDSWCIGDFGFCGLVDKPSTTIYGNLPYIAPEVINGKEYTFKSDIYSIGMLMWEIASGQPPFINYNDDYYIAKNIVNGIRPKIVPGIPFKYKNLMERCWNADPSERPDTSRLWNEIIEIKTYYHNNPDELPQLDTKIDENTYSKMFTSKIHKFENLPEPRNATEGIIINIH